MAENNNKQNDEQLNEEQLDYVSGGRHPLVLPKN